VKTAHFSQKPNSRTLTTFWHRFKDFLKDLVSFEDYPDLENLKKFKDFQTTRGNPVKQLCQGLETSTQSLPRWLDIMFKCKNMIINNGPYANISSLSIINLLVTII